jgi:YggT family protein
MFVIGNFVDAIAVILDVVLQTLLVVILINALLSWVRPDPSNPIVMFLERVSDLVCDPFVV